MISICEDKMCAGCMACVDACPTGAIDIVEGVDYYSPDINQEKCLDCSLCLSVCQQLRPATKMEPIKWKQGWANDDRIRRTSSSGGFATAIARSFVSKGGIVCACTFEQGRFGFDLVDTIEATKRFSGSKYVKSNPQGMYKKVKKLLEKERDILFIGLPCQVSSMRNYVGNALENRLYTIDLICHGTPAPHLLELFLSEYGKDLNSMESISFRGRSGFQILDSEEPVEEAGIVDRYLTAFLGGLDYTHNCYACNYAETARVSDLTLGDSWGSNLSDELTDGVSLVLCQTSKGETLLSESDLTLFDVDADCAIENNKQLREPSSKPDARTKFLALIDQGVSFGKAVSRCLPKQCFRQDVKRYLSKLGLWKLEDHSRLFRSSIDDHHGVENDG